MYKFNGTDLKNTENINIIATEIFVSSAYISKNKFSDFNSYD
jgi:hypothetical protein